jgi:hypothetical protein
VHDAVPFMELVEFGETPGIFCIWHCSCQLIDLPRMLERIFWPTLVLYMIHKGSFLPKSVELFEKCLKFWSFLWMVPELVRHAVYVLYFIKLITQTLPVTDTYDKNRSFAAKFVKTHTLTNKFRQAGLVSYSSDKMVLCRWVLLNILSNKVLTNRT